MSVYFKNFTPKKLNTPLVNSYSKMHVRMNDFSWYYIVCLNNSCLDGVMHSFEVLNVELQNKLHNPSVNYEINLLSLINSSFERMLL